MAEVYAGFLSHADHEIGRLLDYLEQSGQLDNTIIVLVSDNGASGEGGPNGSVNENKFFNEIPDSIEANLPHLEELGSPATYNHYPTGWAWAFNTPFKLWKRYSNYEGGTADPMIVSWPTRITSAGFRRQYVHAVDIVPTLYSLLGVEPPDVVKGYTQFPLEGISFDATLNDATATTDKQTQFYSMGGTRAIWHQGWKAAALSPAAPDMWANYATQRWELFNTEEDPSECHDLADAEPERLQELIQLWWAQAGQYGALPLENRSALEILTTDRPQLTKPRNRYVYYPGTAEVPESVAPNIRNRSYTVAVEVTIDTPDAAGVLFAHGARFGGHALYVKDGKLKYVYNFVGDLEQIVESAEPLPTGRVIVSASFEREGDSMPTEGTLTLHVGKREVGRGRIKTQPGKFSIAGEGLNIGKDGAEPVTTRAGRPGPSPAARSTKRRSTSAASRSPIWPPRRAWPSCVTESHGHAGDIPMLRFARHPGRDALRLLVLHDDPDREFDYVAGAEDTLDRARERSWTAVSIEADWATVFPERCLPPQKCSPMRAWPDPLWSRWRLAGPGARTGAEPGAADPAGCHHRAHPRITGTIYGECSGFGEDRVHPDAPNTPGNPDPPRRWCSGGG